MLDHVQRLNRPSPFQQESETIPKNFFFLSHFQTMNEHLRPDASEWSIAPHHARAQCSSISQMLFGIHSPFGDRLSQLLMIGISIIQVVITECKSFSFQLSTSSHTLSDKIVLSSMTFFSPSPFEYQQGTSIASFHRSENGHCLLLSFYLIHHGYSEPLAVRVRYIRARKSIASGSFRFLWDLRSHMSRNSII